MGPDFNPEIETTGSGDPEEGSDMFAAAYDRYERTVGVVNDHTSRGHLIKAGESLLEISRWLSGNVDALSEVTLELRRIHG